MLYSIKFLIFRFRLLKLKLMNDKLQVGKKFKCGSSCTISPKNDIIIGSNFFMGNNCHLASDLIIGNNVLVHPGLLVIQDLANDAVASLKNKKYSRVF